MTLPLRTALALTALLPSTLVAQTPWGAPVDSATTAFVDVAVVPMDRDRIILSEAKDDKHLVRRPTIARNQSVTSSSQTLVPDR